MRPPTGRFVVEHALPGRLRLRLPSDVDLQPLIEAFKTRPGILEVTGSPTTGGMLIRFDPARVDVGTLLGVLDEHALEAQISDRAPAPGTLAEAVTSAVVALDEKVKDVTRSAIGLGTLVPMGLLTWAAREIALGRARPLAWTSAIWYAHGVLRDYDRETRREPPTAGTSAP